MKTPSREGAALDKFRAEAQAAEDRRKRESMEEKQAIRLALMSRQTSRGGEAMRRLKLDPMHNPADMAELIETFIEAATNAHDFTKTEKEKVRRFFSKGVQLGLAVELVASERGGR